MDYQFIVDGRPHQVSIEYRDGKIVATCDARRMELDVHQVDSGTLSLLVDGKSFMVHFARSRRQILVSVGVRQFCLEEPKQGSSSYRYRNDSLDENGGVVKAPMPGMVIKVSVAEGNEVNPGDGLVVVEAMKMEHEMRAAFAAVVEKVHVQAGQQVEAFEPLVELRAKPPES